MFRGAFQPWHLLILVLVVVVVFGWKKLPDAARSLGRSARILKSEVDEMKAESSASKQTVNGETVRDESVHDSEERLRNQTHNSGGSHAAGTQPQAGHPDGFPQRDSQNGTASN